jgi:Carboxypeptidase regulatory-like domain/TonB dependent receptor
MHQDSSENRISSFRRRAVMRGSSGNTGTTRAGVLSRSIIFLFAMTLAVGAAVAQSTTATIRGKVQSEQGTDVAGAQIVATNTASGFTRDTTAYNDGAYTLNGLTPGTYNIVVSSDAYKAKTEKVTVLIGQSLDLNFRLAPSSVVAENITVVGNQLVDTHTAEAATNVTTQQIENLPQDDRNFLNFAAMAPGIRLSTDPARKTIAGDAQNAEQTNIFIDGVSFKNDVLLGGVAGQDSSRGNPFPQNAVQEFRVITQNYSAQYEKASSAIITAVTKSGGNQMDGQVFAFYQPKQWVAATPQNFQFSTSTTNATYHRYQPGISFGGPIVKDKLHYFFSYEGQQESGTTPVTVNNAQFANQFAQYIGVFSSPFRSNLGFGKLSLQPMANQLLDLSASYRKEYDIRDFGGQTSFQAASKVNNWVYDTTLRHQWNNNSALNQASLTWQKYSWNPSALNPNLVGQDFQGAIRIGGKDTTQQFDQRRIELRDDYNFAPLKMLGDQSFQVGGNFDFMNYRINRSQDTNPIFRYRIDPANGLTFAQPFEATYGFGNPLFSTSNHEYGVYGQDNWNVNQHLNLNLGLRWDYESNMLDQNFVTPASIVAGLKGKVFPANGVNFTIPDQYFSTGSSRKPVKDEFQPRLGASYDLRGDGRSVVFAGAGRYYDRLFLNYALEGRFRLQFPVYNIEFSPTGAPRDGGPTIMWDPSFMSAAGLNALIARVKSINPEIYLLSNNTKAPYSNQANIGFRQALGTWLGSASYNIVRGYHGPTWVSATGTCCQALVPGFGNIIISDPSGGKRFWYNAWQFSLDRPYVSGWGAHLAYSHATTLQNGGQGGTDFFAFDLPNTADYARHPVTGSEPNHLVATGIFGIPFDLRFSTTITLGTGPATDVLDLSQGFDLAGHLKTGVLNSAVYPPKTWGFGYRDIDLRLEKDFATFGRSSVAVIGEVFNAGNFKNFGCLSNFLGPGDNPANLGKPGCVVSLGRREQLGLKLNF